MRKNVFVRLKEALNRLTQQSKPFRGIDESMSFHTPQEKARKEYANYKSIILIALGAKLLGDAKIAYDCVRYLSPIHNDWSVIKYDQNLKAKAESIFQKGKVPITLDQCLKHWAWIERYYYDIDTIFDENTGKFQEINSESRYSYYFRQCKITALESVVKFYILFTRWNYSLYQSGFYDTIDKFTPAYFKDNSPTLADEIYPPWGWHEQVQNQTMSREYVEEHFIDNFRERLSYEREIGELKEIKNPGFLDLKDSYQQTKAQFFHDIPK